MLARRSLFVLALCSACRVTCAPDARPPPPTGRNARDTPVDEDRAREQAQWERGIGTQRGGPVNVPAGVMAGVGGGTLLVGVGVAAAMSDGGAPSPPPPKDQH